MKRVIGFDLNVTLFWFLRRPWLIRFQMRQVVRSIKIVCAHSEFCLKAEKHWTVRRDFRKVQYWQSRFIELRDKRLAYRRRLLELQEQLDD